MTKVPSSAIRGYSKRTRRAFRQVEPVLIPLLELFATVDDVFVEDGAFDEEHIKKSLGRIYREWKVCRAKLDPDFNPKRYSRRRRSTNRKHHVEE